MAVTAGTNHDYKRYLNSITEMNGTGYEFGGAVPMACFYVYVRAKL
jgi:hypothetical protein